MIGAWGLSVAEDWKARIVHARQGSDLRRGTINVRTPLASMFRRMIQTVLDPAFREVAEFARGQGVDCLVECQIGGVQPRAMLCVRPSGRSIRYQLDPDGLAVREIEGVYHRPMGQRKVWDDIVSLERELNAPYARAAAAAIVQDFFRTARAAAGE
jgi:hypothetical protein